MKYPEREKDCLCGNGVSCLSCPHCGASGRLCVECYEKHFESCQPALAFRMAPKGDCGPRAENE